MKASEHPDYTTEPFQASLERERTLHRVIAVSAFATALCVLPIAQYLLLGGGSPQQTTQENGQVAGVATEAPVDEVTLNNIAASPSPSFATLTECVNAKDTNLADLDRFLEGKKRAMLRDYDAAVSGYRQALQSLSATAPESEKQALNSLMDQEYQKYLKDLSDVEKAVTISHDEIMSQQCPAS